MDPAVQTGMGSHAKVKESDRVQSDWAANVHRVLRRIGWSWEKALEVKTQEGERLHITQCPEGCWEHRIRQAARERRVRQAANRKAAKDPEKLDIQMSTRLLREQTLTIIQKGQLRAILAGAVHTFARMWARGTENEDLTHLWWNCQAEQYAHISEKVPQPTNVETMHPAFRDMMLAQKDTQLLDWERTNRTNEIAAVAADEKLRNRVEDARGRDDGKQDERCQGGRRIWRVYGRTGRALTLDGKRSREREQESTSRKTTS